MVKKTKKNILLYANKLERFGYLGVLVWFSLQPFLAQYFTFDGPAHLYNSVAINQMWFQGAISNYFMINPVLVPNWLGHLILFLFQQVLNPINSELLLLSLIIFISNVFFRKLIKSLRGNIWATWLFFPFSMSFLYFMGFYNLVIAIAIMFLLLEQLILLGRKKEKKLKNYLLLALLFLLIYFSHLFIFLFTGFVSAILILAYSEKAKVVINLLKLLAVSILPLFLSIIFISKQPKGNYEYISFPELIEELLHGRILTVFGDPEVMLSTSIVSLIIIATLISLLKYSKLRSKEIYINLSIVLFCLTLYFILPNANGYIGFISVRFSLLIYISLIVYLSQSYKRIETFNFILLLFVGTITLISIKRTRQFFGNYTAMNRDYKEVLFVAKNVIPNNCIISLKNKPNHWFYPHLDNYLGIYKKNVVIIESNYELPQKYFPLIKNSNISTDTLKIIEVEFYSDSNNKESIYQSPFISVK